jgi:hypothetical protein
VTTYNQILDRCKQESDNVNSSFVSDAEWAHYIGQSYAELFGLVVQAYGNDYFVADPHIITTDGTNYLYDLPADFFKLLGVDLQVQGAQQWVTLKPFVFAERNNFAGPSPIPMAGQTVRLWYAPLPPTFDSGEDLPDNLAMWSEYIVIDAAMKAMAKEESDTSVLAQRKAAITARINAEAENRDAGSSARIADVYRAQSQGMKYSIKGSQLWLYGGSTPVTPYAADGVFW